MSLLLGTLAPRLNAAPRDLGRFVSSASCVALLVEVASRRLIGVANAKAAATLVVPPGSTLKPFVLSALVRSGRLDAQASFLCPGRLTIEGRVLDCSHPPLTTPIHVDSAIAYSCNCFVAHAAERFSPSELARVLEGYGFASQSGLLAADEARGTVLRERERDRQRLQALGEDGSAITAAELALAYRSLSLQVRRPEVAAILAGLEGAVEYGTAQNARVIGARVAGKTGSVMAASGQSIAWFAGFLPSRSPEVVTVIMLPGRSGGADAAPVAGRIFEAYRAGRL
jgi:cell division protein FtsI/penicillin-binding protein 2